MKIIRLEPNVTFPVQWFEYNKMKLYTSDWIAWFDDKNNIIYLKSFASTRSLFHELCHYLTDIIVPIEFKRLRKIIDFFLIDRYPRYIYWFNGILNIW